jgi:hypothetical protein
MLIALSRFLALCPATLFVVVDSGLDIREQLISFPKLLVCYPRSCGRSVRPSKVRKEKLVLVVAMLAVGVPGKRVALIPSATSSKF